MVQDAGWNVKILSERIGHADQTVTQKIYGHKSRGIDRPLAQAMGDLIALAAGLGTGESDPLVTNLATSRLPEDTGDDKEESAATG